MLKWWIDRMGDAELNELTTADVLSVWIGCQSWAEPFHRGLLSRFFRRVCAWGTKQKFFRHDPCAGMELPNESTPRLRVLSQAEEKALCGALREPYAL
jgi:hypothetical protein